MRQYTIDELRYADYEKITAYLDKNVESGVLGGIYKLHVDEGVLTQEQKSHETCRPHYVILDLVENRLTCEFLVRSSGSLKCDCAAMATDSQRNWLIESVDGIFKSLGLVY